MKRFVFRLDSILNMRAREEAAAREILERCLNVQRSAERDLDEGSLQLDRCEQALASQRAGKSSIHEHLILLNADRLQREHCARLTMRLAAVTKEAEAQRALFETARRKHQAIVRLYERHSREHAATGRRHEENDISDLINSRHARTDGRACA
jgi:flagellar export protein FliJ